MSEQEASRGALKLVRRFLGLVVVLGLAAAVLFLLSERNARTFAVEQQGDRLVVMRGRMLPFGLEPFVPPDKLLAQAYAPMPLEGDSPGEVLLNRFENEYHVKALLEPMSHTVIHRVKCSPELLDKIAGRENKRLRNAFGEDLVLFRSNYEERHALENHPDAFPDKPSPKVTYYHANR